MTNLLSSILESLPPEPDTTGLLTGIRQMIDASGRKLVVVASDTDGLENLPGLHVLTEWDEPSLAETLRRAPRLFLALTDAKRLNEGEAALRNIQLARQLVEASGETYTDFVVASYISGNLQGHYPAEIRALQAVLATSPADPGEYDGHLFAPADFEAGCYTVNDTHYLTTANGEVYLPDWIEQKSKGFYKARKIASLSLELIRQGGTEGVAEALQQIEGDRPVIVNAASNADLAIVALGVLQAEAAGKRFLYQSAAGFIRLRGGLAI